MRERTRFICVYPRLSADEWPFAYTAPMPELNSKRRSELRAEAHKLSPIVIIGDKGLTDEVLAEIDRALKAHELIKVRAATNDRDARDVWMESICGKLEAHPIQQIGKVLVVYRAKPAEEKRPSPRPSPKPAGETQKRRKETVATSKQRARASKPPVERDEGGRSTRTGRPRSRTASPLPASGSQRRRPRTSR
jgi:RNA-binding protein